jgi:hypothetical protein
LIFKIAAKASRIQEAGDPMVQEELAIVLEYKWWWRNDCHPFEVEDEGFLNDYSLGVDKFGHVYTSYFYFNALHNLMKWGRYDESTTM